VLRHLDMTATSSSAMRSVRRRADALGLDYSHFTGQRRWTDQQLMEAVANSRSWGQVVQALGLADASSQSTLKGHAARLGLDVTHLTRPTEPRVESPLSLTPAATNLRRACSLMAATWFVLCGHDVSWPLEPARYDLLVTMEGRVQRVQVKTTTVRTGASWTVWLSTSGRARATYDVDEIDLFFVIDGDLTCYVIPSKTVGGLHAIQLSAYAAYRVGSLRDGLASERADEGA
jgi:hypothetical protein